MPRDAASLTTLSDCQRAVGWSWADRDGLSVLRDEEGIALGRVDEKSSGWSWVLHPPGEEGWEVASRWVTGASERRWTAQRSLLASGLLLRWFDARRGWEALAGDDGGLHVLRVEEERGGMRAVATVAEVLTYGDFWQVNQFVVVSGGFDVVKYGNYFAAVESALVHAIRLALKDEPPAPGEDDGVVDLELLRRAGRALEGF